MKIARKMKVQDLYSDPRIDAILHHYGRNHQLLKLQEEAQEVAQATRDHFFILVRYEQSDRQEQLQKTSSHLAEEMADTLIMIHQVMKLEGLKEEVEKMIEAKLQRQLMRMEKER